MDLEVGAILTGKVTGITKFGAFVTFPDGKSGLVHISEIANTYVSDIHDHLTDGQEVKVKVIGIDENKRINLSIKRTEERPRPQQRSFNNNAPRSGGRPNNGGNRNRFAQSGAATIEKTADEVFEDRLKQFMQDSDSKISGIKQYSDKRVSRRRSR
jgi:S1 RNA binding domain protein